MSRHPRAPYVRHAVPSRHAAPRRRIRVRVSPSKLAAAKAALRMRSTADAIDHALDLAIIDGSVKHDFVIFEEDSHRPRRPDHPHPW